jgi:prepilin-type N-terminal cleavage/methylation domain-containing protein
MRKRGFTLIELLVVIAIIALLLSVMLPSLRKAKAYARKVIDSTNLRSLSMALHIYLNTNNDRFFDYGTGTLWMDRISDAIDDLDAIRFCPETTGKVQEVLNDYNGSNSIWGTSMRPWLWNNSSNPIDRYEMGSYGLNGWFYAECKNKPAGHTCLVCQSSDADRKLLFQNRAAVRNPGKTPFILDANWVDGWARNTNTLPATGYRYDTGDTTHGGMGVTTMIGRYVVDRHGPETNVIFLDGQVQTIPHADLWTLFWHRGSTPNFNATVPQPIPAKK